MISVAGEHDDVMETGLTKEWVRAVDRARRNRADWGNGRGDW